MFLVLLYLLAPVVSSTGVQIVGLFPKEDRYKDPGLLPEQVGTAWCHHCVAMFRAAITIAGQRDIRVNDFPISYTILETGDDGHGFDVLDILCQLITNATVPDIVGIVGPSSSIETRLLGPFAARIGLPLVSYAATAADLSDTQLFPTFYRTVPSDELLAKAIVQLFSHFSWETCTVIFQKDDYGYGGIRELSEKYRTEFIIKEQLTFDASSNLFNANLTKTLRKSRSRIILVWANDSTSTRIIKHALEEGLIGGSYVWVLTDEIDLTEFRNCSQSSLLEGLLTVAPTNGHPTGANQLLSEALATWRKSSFDSYTLPDNDQSINPFAMFAFDAAWTLIEALNKSSFHNPPLLLHSPLYCFNSVLKNKIEYDRYLKDTNFCGVSGDVQFSNNISNNRVGHGYYVLKNLQLKPDKKKTSNKVLKYERVMIWDSANPKWLNLTESPPTTIIWPNKSNVVPSGHPKIGHEQIRILVIESIPFVIVRNLSSAQEATKNLEIDDYFTQEYKVLSTLDSNITIYGFAADLICKLKDHMEFTFTIDVAPPYTSYHSLVASLANNGSKWDVIISDITITSDRLQTVDFSLGVHENVVRVIIRDNPSLFTFDLFSFMSPFSSGVWLLTLLVVIYSGVLIYIFERRAIPEDGANPKLNLRAVAIGIYHALCSVVSMSGDLPLTTMSSRMMTIGLYILSVILLATYTANLSSYLTLQRTLPAISGIDDIKNGRIPFSRVGVISNSSISDYYERHISAFYYSLVKTQNMYTLLLENGIDAALGDSATVEYILDRYYCGRLIVVGAGFANASFGIVMRKNYEYKADFDMSILSMRESGTLEKLEQKWFRQRKCITSHLLSNSQSGIGIDAQGKIPINVLSGLYLTFLVISVVAIALHIWHFRADITRNSRDIVKRIRKRFVRRR